MRLANQRWLPVFFGLAACSWMPHWACHYYRLETASSFVVGNWQFSRSDSWISLVVYSSLICLNLLAVVVPGSRFWAALLSGAGHSVIGGLHVVRVVRPFRFEVFGYPWSRGASIREIVIVCGFGVLCLIVAWRARRMET